MRGDGGRGQVRERLFYPIENGEVQSIKKGVPDTGLDVGGSLPGSQVEGIEECRPWLLLMGNFWEALF